MTCPPYEDGSPRVCREQGARKALTAARASRDLQVATAAQDPRANCPAWMPPQGSCGPMRLIDLADMLPDPWRLALEQTGRPRRERAGRSQNLPGNSGDDDGDPTPEGPASQVSREADRLYGGPDRRASGRAAR